MVFHHISKNWSAEYHKGPFSGPFSFFIYVNDLLYSTHNLQYVLFADDTNVFVKVQIPNLYLIMLMINISNWMKANILILNIDKTNYILFGTKTIIYSNLNLYYRDREIKRVYSTKFLGVFIDDKLSWNHHVDYLCKTISKNIGIPYKLQFLPQYTFKMLYHSLVSSHIKYCNIVWGFTSKKYIERIYKLHKRGIRLITHSPYLSPSIPLFVKTRFLPVRELIALDSAIFMFILRNNILPEAFHNYFIFNSSIHDYNTRNAHTIHPPLNRISITQSTIYYNGSILWNSLQTSIKSSKTLRQFKRLYKRFLLELWYFIYMHAMFPDFPPFSLSFFLLSFITVLLIPCCCFGYNYCRSMLKINDLLSCKGSFPTSLFCAFYDPTT